MITSNPSTYSPTNGRTTTDNKHPSEQGNASQKAELTIPS